MDQDRMIQQLMNEVAKWKNRALEAALRACDECDECDEMMTTCDKCRIKIIKESALE